MIAACLLMGGLALQFYPSAGRVERTVRSRIPATLERTAEMPFAAAPLLNGFAALKRFAVAGMPGVKAEACMAGAGCGGVVIP